MMRKTSFDMLVFFTFYLSLWVQYGKALKLTINPATSNGLVPNEISFRCSPEAHESFVTDILQMRLKKEGVTIANLQTNSEPTRINDEVGQNFEFSGEIKPNALDSYLSATLTNTKEEGLFDYECEIVFLNSEDKVQVIASNASLQMSNTDVVPIFYNLEKRLITLKAGVNYWKIIAKKYVVDPLKKLENIYQKQLLEINATKDKCIERQNISAVYFLAWNRQDVTVWREGNTLINRDTEINIGGGYNSHTGVFIAPVVGYYLFHISITASGGDWAFINLVSSNHRLPLASLRVGDQGSWPEQADTSCVVKLDIGDTVRPKIGKVINNFKPKQDDFLNRFVGVLLGRV